MRWQQRRRRSSPHLRPALYIKRARFPRTFCIRPPPRHGVGDAGPSPLRSKMRPVEPTIPCRLSLPCAADDNISDFVSVSQGCLRCRRSRTWIPRAALRLQALTNTNHPSHLQTHSLQVPPVEPRPQRQRSRAYAAYAMMRFVRLQLQNGTRSRPHSGPLPFLPRKMIRRLQVRRNRPRDHRPRDHRPQGRKKGVRRRVIDLHCAYLSKSQRHKCTESTRQRKSVVGREG